MLLGLFLFVELISNLEQTLGKSKTNVYFEGLNLFTVICFHYLVLKVV